MSDLMTVIRDVAGQCPSTFLGTRCTRAARHDGDHEAVPMRAGEFSEVFWSEDAQVSA